MFSGTISNFNPTNFQFHRSWDEQERAGENERKRGDSDKHPSVGSRREDEEEAAAAEEEANYPCGEADSGEVERRGCLFWVR